MTTNTWQVSASSDDCRVFDTDATNPPWDNSIDLTTSHLRIGRYSVTERYGSGARFVNVGIGQGNVISSAYLKLRSDDVYGDRSGSQDCIIVGEDADNASTFSTLNDYNGRSRTSANVSWVFDSSGAGIWHTSVDIKTVIQEIVDRGGWVSGNALAIFVETTEDSTSQDDVFQSYDEDPSYAPKLEVTWTTAAGVASKRLLVGVGV